MTIPDTTENVLDTTVHEPPTSSEIDLLIFALERSRAQFAWSRTRSSAALARALTDGDLDHPASAARSGHPPILRRILIDMHQEYARHAGHADLLREAIDGLTGANPPQP
jgi:hypothetical protein